MNLGWTEILLIGGIALLIFGPSKLPGLGKSMGQAIRGFKKGLNTDAEDEGTRPVEQVTHQEQKNYHQQTQEEKDAQKKS